ncbi:unnamed protein product [Closterium sp. NIES-54]
MIGNDMPPLQCEGQLYNNLQYTLQYEPKHLPGCRRLWVLNNIVNSTVEKMTLELLLNNGYTMDDILVFRINYTRLASLPEHAWLDAVTGAWLPRAVTCASLFSSPIPSSLILSSPIPQLSAPVADPFRLPLPSLFPTQPLSCPPSQPHQR